MQYIRGLENKYQVCNALPNIKNDLFEHENKSETKDVHCNT